MRQKFGVALQLHITGNCNLRCKHCYIDDFTSDMPFEQIKNVLKQFDRLVKRIEKENRVRVVPFLRITGGEPFLHRDINKVLQFVARKRYNLSIMSNGTLVNEKTVAMLKRIKRFQSFQVSIDGDEETHDTLRGNGSFKKVEEALDLLHRGGIKTRVSFTANMENYKEFAKIVKVCEEHNVDSVWSDRYIPFEHNEVNAINSENMKEYVEILKTERDNAKCGLTVENLRALQFIGNDSPVYYCKAGENIVTVDEHGNIMPCRRMPIICGNINTTTLADVYFNNDVFVDLRKHTVSDKCKRCEYVTKCKGGARCMTYAVKGKYADKDPCCYICND